MTSPVRICQRTGLALVQEGGERMFRVAKPKYGPLSAPTRTGADRPTHMGRYDSPGCTVYVASEPVIAFSEVLSPFKRQLGATDPLEADALALGMTRDEFLEQVAKDWDELQCMGIGAVPRQWRVDRAMYNLYGESTPDAWYIDVEHPESIAVLEAELETELAHSEVASLTIGVLRGDNRYATTKIGEHLRTTLLDTGAPARGIQFGSKFGGGGWCRAIWVPPDPEDNDFLVALSPEQILTTDEDLARAAERFRIRVF